MKRWLVTFGGVGYAPVAPGSFGSAAAILCLFLWLCLLVSLDLATPTNWNLSLLAGIGIAGAICVACGPWIETHFGRHDPGAVVIDEVAGVCLTLLFVPLVGGPGSWMPFAVAFLAFRVFDVWKPPPCGKLENLPAGWGILADDLMAAVYANLVCQLVVRFLLP